MVGGVQLGDQGPVLVGDEDGTPPGRLLAHLVPHVHAGVPRLLLQDLAAAVRADAAHVGGEILLPENPLGHSDGVLSGSASDVVNFVLLQQILEYLLLLGQDGVVSLILFIISIEKEGMTTLRLCLVSRSVLTVAEMSSRGLPIPRRTCSLISSAIIRLLLRSKTEMNEKIVS